LPSAADPEEQVRDFGGNETSIRPNDRCFIRELGLLKPSFKEGILRRRVMKSSRLTLIFAILVLSLGMAFTTLAGARSAELATTSNTTAKTAVNAIKDIEGTSDTASDKGGRSKTGFLEAAAATRTVCVEGMPTCDYSSIQTAVEASGEGDLIKVAAGIYSGVSVRPRDDFTSTGTVTQVVYLDKSITIQGGYTTTNWTTPDSEANPTILDALGEGRVIYITGEVSPTIVGLRITGGDATGMGGCPDTWRVEVGDAGGGIYVISATATILNNQIYSNTAEQAGGVHFLNYDGTFQGNAVTHNIGYFGGLCFSCDGANLSNNDFSSNDGGGLGLMFDGSTVHGNTISDNDGNGLTLFKNFSTISANTITANTITSNTHYGGAGVYNAFSPATFVNNVIAGNHTDGSSSGVYISGDIRSISKWLHNTIANNTGGDGSGIYVTSGPHGQPVSSIFTNTVIASQTVGISVNNGSTATLNGVLWYNTAITSSQSLTSTIFVHNQVTGDPDFVDPGTGDYHITASSAAWDSGVNSGWLNDMDDQARPMGWGYDLGADEVPGANLGLLMEASAEYANAGDALMYSIKIDSRGEEDATGVVLTDTLDNYLRGTLAMSSLGGCTITDPGWGGEVVCTLGAMPMGTVAAVTITVEVSTTVPPGQEVSNNAVVMANETTNSAQTSLMAQDCHVRINEGLTEYDTVQDAVDLASPGDLIKVAGTCIGVNDHAGQPQQVYLDRDITIRGGYTTTNWTTPDIDGHPTTLDALGLGRVVKITPEISVTLEGLRITGGDTAPVVAIGGDTWADGWGGGISSISATLTLQGNQIEDNRAFAAGALYVWNTDVTLGDNTITNNAANFCGGIYIGGGRAVLVGNTLTGNTASEWGAGGGYLISTIAILEDNVIAWNNAGLRGGLILYGDSDITMTNNVVADNHAGSVGGGVLIGSSPGSLINMAHNTIARNTAGDGSGIYLYPGSTVALTNTILVSHTVGISLTGNSTATINGILWHNTPITVSQSVTSTLTAYNQVIGAPAFEEDGYHLTPFSAAIDKGVDSGVAVDIDGDTRPQGAGYDLGADEIGLVTLSLEPLETTVYLGQTFDIATQVLAGDQPVDGASTYINFDPTVLQVVNITPGTTLPLVLQNQYDNLTGEIDYAAGKLSNFPTGTFTLVTLTFEAIAQSDGTQLAFNHTAPRKSDVTYGGGSVLDNTQDGTIVISDDAELAGSVELQGRSAAPDPSWAISLTAKLIPEGETTPLYEFTTTTDEYGEFTIQAIAPGIYTGLVKGSHTLQNSQVVTLTIGNNTVDFGILREGDANDDNFVTLLDFSILASTFGICEGTLGYDDRADFNEDGCITLTDFSLLATNFGEGGESDELGTLSTQKPKLIPEDVIIAIEPAMSKVMVGYTFTITIQLSTGNQLIDGAQASINFDPSVLQVISITGNPSMLPLELMNDYDNVTGTLDYAAGTLSNFPSGTFSLAEIVFEAVVETSETFMTFNYIAPRQTDVTYGGGSVLTDDVEGAVSISAGHDIYLPLILKGDPGLASTELKTIQKGSLGVIAKPDRVTMSSMLVFLLLTGGVGAGWRLKRRK
jgi:uncharacterized repeat protein (TIGR01451 family)